MHTIITIINEESVKDWQYELVAICKGDVVENLSFSISENAQLIEIWDSEDFIINELYPIAKRKKPNNLVEINSHDIDQIGLMFDQAKKLNLI